MKKKTKRKPNAEKAISKNYRQEIFVYKNVKKT